MKHSFLFVLLWSLLTGVQAQNSMSNAPIYIPSPNGESLKFPTVINGTMRNVLGADIVKDRVATQRFLDSIASLRDAIAIGGGGGGGGEVNLTNYYTKSESDTKFPLVTGSYTDPSWLTISRAKVGLPLVPNVDATNPANIVWTSTYAAVSAAEKASYAAKQAALGFTPVSNAFQVNGVTLSGSSITLTKANFTDLNNLDNTSDAAKWAAPAALTNKTIDGDLNTVQDIPMGAIPGLFEAITAKVTANAAITPGTFTKLTYDAKGLITSGSTLIEGDIPSLGIPKITGLQAALDAKQPLGSYVTGADLAEGLGTKQDARDGYDLSQNNFSDGLFLKLNGIQNGATANQTDAYLLSRANQTGYNPSSSFDPAMLEAFDPDGYEDESIAMLKANGSTLWKQGSTTNILTTSGVATNVDARIYYQPVYISKVDTCTFIRYEVATAGVYTADNNNKVGIYKYNGDGTASLVASSANTANMYTTLGMNSVNLSAQYIMQPGLYWIAFLWNASATTTAPVMRASTGRAGGSQTGDIAGTSFKFLFLQNTQTDLPATVTISAATVSSEARWFGVGQ